MLALDESNPEKGNLYLSSVSFLNNYEEVKGRKIDCILTVLDDWAWKKFSVKEKVEHMGIGTHHRINLEDDEDNSLFHLLEPTMDFIKQHLQKTNVLVHCQAGVSRSSSFVIAFLMKELNLTLLQAKKYAKERRYCVSPNGAFEKEL